LANRFTNGRPKILLWPRLCPRPREGAYIAPPNFLAGVGGGRGSWNGMRGRGNGGRRIREGEGEQRRGEEGRRQEGRRGDGFPSPKWRAMDLPMSNPGRAETPVASTMNIGLLIIGYHIRIVCCIVEPLELWGRVWGCLSSSPLPIKFLKSDVQICRLWYILTRINSSSSSTSILGASEMTLRRHF